LLFTNPHPKDLSKSPTLAGFFVFPPLYKKSRDGVD